MSDEFRSARRAALKYAAASLTLLVTPVGGARAAAMPTVLGVRVWPAADYTRITLEHDQPMRFSHMLVKDPYRLVVDLEDDLFGLEVNLASKLGEDLARPGEALLTPAAVAALDRRWRGRLEPHASLRVVDEVVEVQRLRL